MRKLLKDLANLSSLRDREALDLAMVKLMDHCALWRVTAVRLLRVVGPPSDQHWVTRGLLDAQHNSTPERDAFRFDVSTLPRFEDFADRQAAIVTGSVVRSGQGPFTTIFPINAQASICSVLEVESDEMVSADTEAMIDSLLRIYDNLYGLLDSGEHDSLTELLNRKTFDSAFFRPAQVQDDSTYPDRRQYLAPVTYWLAVIDIDHFRHVNDSFGRVIGDEVLWLLARQMRGTFRVHDKLYRFEGEEFVALLRCSHHADATAALERFRHQVEKHDFPQIGHITVSIGFAPLRDNDSPNSAYGRANKAVQYAKGHGRNQTRSFSTLVASGELQAQDNDSEKVDFL